MVLLVWLVTPDGATGHIQVTSISFFTIPRLEVDVLPLLDTNTALGVSQNLKTSEYS